MQLFQNKNKPDSNVNTTVTLTSSTIANMYICVENESNLNFTDITIISCMRSFANAITQNLFWPQKLSNFNAAVIIVILSEIQFYFLLTLLEQNFSKLLFFLFTSFPHWRNSSRDCFKSPFTPAIMAAR